VTLAGIVEAMFIGWAYDIHNFRKWVTAVLEWRLGLWWKYCMRYITPLIVFTIVVASIWEDFIKQIFTGFAQTYGGHPLVVNLGVFLSVILAIPIVSWLLLPRLRKKVNRREGLFTKNLLGEIEHK